MLMQNLVNKEKRASSKKKERFSFQRSRRRVRGPSLWPPDLCRAQTSLGKMAAGRPAVPRRTVAPSRIPAIQFATPTAPPRHPLVEVEIPQPDSTTAAIDGRIIARTQCTPAVAVAVAPREREGTKGAGAASLACPGVETKRGGPAARDQGSKFR